MRYFIYDNYNGELVARGQCSKKTIKKIFKDFTNGFSCCLYKVKGSQLVYKKTWHK